eukprot:5424803-Prymnesium_polylepis.1
MRSSPATRIWEIELNAAAKIRSRHSMYAGIALFTPSAEFTIVPSSFSIQSCRCAGQKSLAAVSRDVTPSWYFVIDFRRAWFLVFFAKHAASVCDLREASDADAFSDDSDDLLLVSVSWWLDGPIERNEPPQWAGGGASAEEEAMTAVR